MECQICRDLEESRDKRQGIYNAAREVLSSALGISTSEEYASLLIATDNARLELNQIRLDAIDHQRMHSQENDLPLEAEA